MKRSLRVMNWPLRTKMAALFILASFLPSGIVMLARIPDLRQQLRADAAAQLTARGTQLVQRLDGFHYSYRRSVDSVARLPNVVEFCEAKAADQARTRLELGEFLNVWPAGDRNVRGIAILDAAGRVIAGTELPLIGSDLSYRAFVREALREGAVISDIHVAEEQVGEVPTIAYLAPVRGVLEKQCGVAVLWVRAASLWDLMRQSNGLAGPGSFAVMFDRHGIRVAHTYSDDIVFHPGGQLSPATIDALVAERRFGTRTRKLLEDVRPFPQQFARAMAEVPDPEMFHGLAPVNNKWNYGVARRGEWVPWTVFYMVPDAALNASLSRASWEQAGLASLSILFALLGGVWFAAVLLKPVISLSRATGELAAGDLTARTHAGTTDELGRLGASFNSMAERIEIQATALQKARDELERRVVERTEELQVEVGERKRAEQAALSSKQLLSGIVESSDDAIISKTLQGIITSWNPGAERLFGFSAQEAVGQSMQMLIPAEKASEEPEILARMARGDAIEHFETVRIKKDGERIDIAATISPIKDSTGQVTGISKIARDITGRKHADARLRAQLQRLSLLQQITQAIGERQDLASIFQVVIRTLQDQLPIDFGCVCLYEPITKKLTVARMALRSQDLAAELPLTEQENIDVGENGLSQCVRGQLIYEPDISQMSSPLLRRLAEGGFRALVAVPLLVESKVFGVLIAARRAQRSFSSGECEFLRQLTEHVALAAHQAQLYGSLQQAYDDLRQTQQVIQQQERLRSLGQMASGIAHDINNAISPVTLYTETLLEKEPNLSPRTREYLEVILRSMDDVAQTVGRLREFYRQREAKQTLVPVQLNPLIEQVIGLTRARWHDMPQQRGVVIELHRDLAPDLPYALGVESEVREALTNLIFNAVDAMPEGGTLTLRTCLASRQRTCVEIRDTGIGMDEETCRRCLEPFFTTKGERGTGLGLAMVYGIVQRHGAEIEIESVPGRGTLFRITFAVPDTSADAVDPEVASQLEKLPALRLLVVDDDPLLIKSLRAALEDDGHTVATADGGQAGIDRFRAAQAEGEPFAVVISDLGMPHVDGRKVASAVKEASPLTPVILLTGWGQRMLAEEEVPPHVDRVLSKPPKLRELRAALLHCSRLADISREPKA
jgi:PAS domain S-box-containing protein